MHLVRAAAAIADPDGIEFAAMPLGAVRASAPKSGAFWEPAEPKTERWLATLPLYERVGGNRAFVAAEILAWMPARPEKWWGRTGALSVLGATIAEQSLTDDKPLRVYRYPRRWNRAGAGGAPGSCILDWESEPARQILRWAKGLIGDDVAHARELQRLVDTRRPKVQFVLRPTGAGTAA
jgi:hypothetical protein